MAIAILTTVLAMVSSTIPLYMVRLAQQRAAAAADAAALAAADVASGIMPGSPCEMAGTLAAANSTRLVACEVDGVVVTVRVDIIAFGLAITGIATAGPPGLALK